MYLKKAYIIALRNIASPSFLPCATSAAVGKSLVATSGRETAVVDGLGLPHTGLLEGVVDALAPPSLLDTVPGIVC